MSLWLRDWPNVVAMSESAKSVLYESGTRSVPARVRFEMGSMPCTRKLLRAIANGDESWRDLSRNDDGSPELR